MPLEVAHRRHGEYGKMYSLPDLEKTERVRMRTILFAQVNTKKENITTLLTDTGQQLALSDEQLQEIDTHLVVRSMEEYKEKFGQHFDGHNISDALQNCNKNESVRKDFTHKLKEHGNKRYEIWYPHARGAALDELSTEISDKNRRRQLEINLGIQAFFQQSESSHKKEGTELLVLNISPEKLLANPVELAKLEKFLETVNRKLYTSDRVNYAVLPEVSFVPLKTDIRERFRGNNSKERQAGVVPAAMTDRLLTVLGRYGVTLLYQYETGTETSAQAFAAKGVSPYKQAAAQYESHNYADYISCCYPNLTAYQNGMYIGAAYVAAAMLSINAGEESMTVFPKELYPYSRQTKSDIGREKYGCLLASETNTQGWGALPNMVMLSSRTCKNRQGQYAQITKQE